MVEIANLIKTSSANATNTTESTVTSITTSNEITLAELNGTHDRYMAHLKCLKENDLLTPDRKVKIVNDLEDIMDQISARHGIKRSNDLMDSTEKDNNKSSVS